MMNKQTMLVAIIALLFGGIGGYVIADRDGSHMMRGYDKNMSDRDHRMGGRMMMNDDDTQMDHMMNMMVASERAFIEGMIPHHQEAVDTAKEVIARGGSTPEIKQLVEGIVTAQESEIAAMKEWYTNWYGTPFVKDETYMPMMRDLENLSGADLDRVFLEDMIMHHIGAIMMARSVAPYVEHDEVKNLSQAIMTTQTAEITKMRSMLQGLQ